MARLPAAFMTRLAPPGSNRRLNAFAQNAFIDAAARRLGLADSGYGWNVRGAALPFWSTIATVPVKALPSLFMMVPDATTAPAGELSGIVTEGGQPVKTGACCTAGGEIVKAIWIEADWPSASVAVTVQVPLPSSADVRARERISVLIWKYSGLKRVLLVVRRPLNRDPSDILTVITATTVPRCARSERAILDGVAEIDWIVG